jgi:ABC-type Mn2+/Zn2+ transport system permease subunit
MPKIQKKRADSEFEQVLIRVGLAVFVLIFLLISYQVTGKTENRSEILIAALFYLGFSISLVIVLWFDTQPSPPQSTWR